MVDRRGQHAGRIRDASRPDPVSGRDRLHDDQSRRSGSTDVRSAAAKSGIHGFTKALAQEVARKGVTVNTVSPGYIATKMVMAVAPEIREEIIRGIPVGRLGTPEEVAHAVAFLISEQSGFITGANLSLNGGQHMF